MPLLRLMLFTLLFLAFHTAQAGAAIIQLQALADGAQANAGAGTGSTATGVLDLTLNDQTGEVSWTGSFTGLVGTYSNAHVHGPAAPGVNGGIVVGTPATTSNNGHDGTVAGNATLTAQQVSDMVNGLHYWNVHSSQNPGGEIRGQIYVVPEPGTALLMALGLAGLAARRRV